MPHLIHLLNKIKAMKNIHICFLFLLCCAMPSLLYGQSRCPSFKIKSGNWTFKKYWRDEKLNALRIGFAGFMSDKPISAREPRFWGSHLFGGVDFSFVPHLSVGFDIGFAYTQRGDVHFLMYKPHIRFHLFRVFNSVWIGAEAQAFVSNSPYDFGVINWNVGYTHRYTRRTFVDYHLGIARFEQNTRIFQVGATAGYLSKIN